MCALQNPAPTQTHEHHAIAGISGKSAMAVHKALVGYAGTMVKLMLRREIGDAGERLLQVELVRGTPVFWQFQLGALLCATWTFYMYACMHVCVCMHARHMHARARVHVCIRECPCVHACAHSMHVYVKCMFVCACVRACMHAFAHNDAMNSCTYTPPHTHSICTKILMHSHS